MAIKDILRPGALQPSAEKSDVADRVNETPLEVSTKTWWQRRAPVIACGSGLFSDGYLNGVRSTLFPQRRLSNMLQGHRIGKHYPQEALQARVQAQ
jgi:hypothetical protein